MPFSPEVLAVAQHKLRVRAGGGLLQIFLAVGGVRGGSLG